MAYRLLKQAGCMSTGGNIETDQAAQIVAHIRESHAVVLYEWPEIMLHWTLATHGTWRYAHGLTAC